MGFQSGIGDWGLGIGDWGLGPIPNPQSPIPPIIIRLFDYKLYNQFHNIRENYLFFNLYIYLFNYFI